MQTTTTSAGAWAGRAALIGLAAAVLVAGWAEFRFVCDDAYILFR